MLTGRDEEQLQLTAQSNIVEDIKTVLRIKVSIVVVA